MSIRVPIPKSEGLSIGGYTHLVLGVAGDE
jgi:hypothetical protein